MRIFKPLGSDKGNSLYVLPRDEFCNLFDHFDIQARAYTALREYGFDVRGEWRIPGSGLKPDLFVFHLNRPLAIIVVKAGSQWREETRQQREYRQFGVPVIAIATVDEVPALITALETLQSA